MNKIQLYGCKGYGSVIAEAFLTLAKIPYELSKVDFENPNAAREELGKLNPLAQVPTLLMQNGSVLAESLAVAAYAHKIAPEAGLNPKDGEDFEKFWRWSCFIIAALYPTFAYGDDTSKWVSNPEGQKQLRASTDKQRQNCFRQLEQVSNSKHFLGVFSAIDVYLGAMIHWRPREEWFQENCPKLFSVGSAISTDPRLAHLWRENFT